MISWLVYSTITGSLVAIAALGAEWLLKSAKRPVRAVWFAAIAATIAFTLSAPFRGEPQMVIDTSQFVETESAAPVIVSEPTLYEVLSARATQLAASVMIPLQVATDFASRAPSAVDTVAGILAVLVAFVALLVLALVYVQSMQMRGKWPLMLMLGKTVRLAPNVGPAVLGLAPPEIVVPRWVLLRNTEEQSLVIEHESEHVRANDPMLLMFACVAVACMPWNPAVWFMWSRLRLAVELDCDRRVLLRGVEKPAYGQLLVELSSSRPWMSPAIPAFSWGTSHLEQRLVAMTARPKRFRMLRRVASASVAAAALLVASNAEVPLVGELQAMEVAREPQAKNPALGGTKFFVDGKSATMEEAYAVMRSNTTNVTRVYSSKNSKQLEEMHIEKYNPGVAAMVSRKSYAEALNPLTGKYVSGTYRRRPEQVQDTIKRKKAVPVKVVRKKVEPRKLKTDSVPKVIYKNAKPDSAAKLVRKIESAKPERKVARKTDGEMDIDKKKWVEKPRALKQKVDTVYLEKADAADGRSALNKKGSDNDPGTQKTVLYEGVGVEIRKNPVTGDYIRPDSIVIFESTKSGGQDDPVIVHRQTGQDDRIRIRGASALERQPEPLIIIDGVVATGTLKDIKKEDIEQIEVIKGAAAVTLYGPTAANGVIRIKMKR